MSLFSFLKEAGEKILDALTPDKAEANGEALTKHVQDALTGIDTSKIQVKVEGEKVIATGEAATQEEKEKSSWRWATWPASAAWTIRSP